MENRDTAEILVEFNRCLVDPQRDTSSQYRVYESTGGCKESSRVLLAPRES